MLRMFTPAPFTQLAANCRNWDLVSGGKVPIFGKVFWLLSYVTLIVHNRIST